MSEKIMDWLRWIAIFLLVSLVYCFLELSALAGKSDPTLYFFGMWLGVSVSMLLPGVIIGLIVTLATKKSKLGMWIMVTINAIWALMVFLPFFL